MSISQVYSALGNHKTKLIFKSVLTFLFLTYCSFSLLIKSEQFTD